MRPLAPLKMVRSQGNLNVKSKKVGVYAIKFLLKGKNERMITLLIHCYGSVHTARTIQSHVFMDLLSPFEIRRYDRKRCFRDVFIELEQILLKSL